MPLYQYSCNICKYEVEKLESFSAEIIQPCPKCLTKTGLVRVISLPNFTLAGSGWYKDAYSTKRT